MDLLHPLIHGFILALGLILPLGPQNAFVLTQGAQQAKYYKVLPVVIAASLSDTLLILLAVFGVSTILMHHDWMKYSLLVFGVIFIVYVGITSWSTSFCIDEAECQELWPISRQLTYTFSVSLINPYAYLDTIAVIGTSSLTYDGLARTVFVTSCIVVSWLWFFALSLAGRYIRQYENITKYAGRVTAIIMWSSAIYLIYRFAFE